MRLHQFSLVVALLLLAAPTGIPMSVGVDGGARPSEDPAAALDAGGSVSNGDFESGTGPTAAGWSSGAVPALRTPAPIAHSGEYALLVAPGDDVEIRSSAFAVEPCGRFDATMWVQDDAKAADVGVEFLAGSSVVGVASLGPRDPATSWTELGFGLDVPPTASGARMFVRGELPTLSHVDDIATSVTFPATPPSIFRSDFNNLTGWTLTGGSSTIQPSTGSPGCFLRMVPACCAAYRDVTRASPILPGGPFNITLNFRGSTRSGSTDVSFEAVDAAGNAIVIEPTAGGSAGNNGWRLVTGTATQLYGDTGTFASWASASTWYTIVVHADPGTAQVYAVIKDVNGAILAKSPIISTGADNFPSLASLRFRGASYSTPAAYDWDTLTITPAPAIPLPPVPQPALFTEAFDNLTAWTVVGSSSTIQCGTGSPGCYLRQVPACCAAYRDVTRSVSLTPGGQYDIVVKVRPTSMGLNTDGAFEAIDNLGNSIVFQPNEGFSNNGFRLFTGNGGTGQTFGDTGAFASWSTASAWYNVTIHVDPTNATAFVRVKTESGTVIATSGLISTGGATNLVTLSTLRFRALTYGGANTIDWDTLYVAKS